MQVSQTCQISQQTAESATLAIGTKDLALELCTISPKLKFMGPECHFYEPQLCTKRFGIDLVGNS